MQVNKQTQDDMSEAEDTLHLLSNQLCGNEAEVAVTMVVLEAAVS